MHRLLENVLPGNGIIHDFEVEVSLESIGRRVLLINARRLDSVQLTLLGVRDVTDRKRAEEKLRQSEERYRLLIESAKEYAIFMINSGGSVATWNSGAQRVFGYAPEEIVGRPGSLLFTEEDRAAGGARKPRCRQPLRPAVPQMTAGTCARMDRDSGLAASWRRSAPTT